MRGAGSHLRASSPHQTTRSSGRSKAEDKPAAMGLKQVKRYRERHDVTLVFASNGHPLSSMTALPGAYQPRVHWPSPPRPLRRAPFLCDRDELREQGSMPLLPASARTQPRHTGSATAVVYGFGELVLACATTIHTQGSEYPAVVIPLTIQHSTQRLRWWV
jgi:hypothetical protein